MNLRKSLLAASACVCVAPAIASTAAFPSQKTLLNAGAEAPITEAAPAALPRSDEIALKQSARHELLALSTVAEAGIGVSAGRTVAIASTGTALQPDRRLARVASFSDAATTNATAAAALGGGLNEIPPAVIESWNDGLLAPSTVRLLANVGIPALLLGGAGAIAFAARRRRLQRFE